MHTGTDPAEIEDFDDWLAELPHPHKIVVAGNHDYSSSATPSRRASASAMPYTLKTPRPQSADCGSGARPLLRSYLTGLSIPAVSRTCASFGPEYLSGSMCSLPMGRLSARSTASNSSVSTSAAASSPAPCSAAGPGFTSSAMSTEAGGTSPSAKTETKRASSTAPCSPTGKAFASLPLSSWAERGGREVRALAVVVRM